MNFKKTLIFLVIFGLLAGVYWWDHKRVKTNEERKEAESRLVTPKRDELTEVTIERGDQKVKLVKQDKAWMLAEPLKARTDEQAVNSLLDEIDRAKKAEPFDLAKDAKLADYGLEQPAVKAEVKAAKDNYVQNVELGSTTPSGDEVYARAGKDGQIFTVSTALKTQLTKPVPDLRDKRTLPANLNQATSVTLAFAGQTFDLAKRDADWKMSQPLTGMADATKVDEVLREWNDIKATDYVDTQPLQLDTLGFTSPTLTATVFVPENADAASTAPTTGTTMTLLVGAPVPDNPSQRYAMQQGGDYAFTIPQASVEKLQPTLDDLRSKQLLTLKPADVGRMIFKVRENTVDLTRDSSGQWIFTDDPKSKLDNSVISQKLSDLTALKATRYFDDPTSPVSPTVSGLDNPNLVLTVASKDGQTTETISTGRKDDNGDWVYARLDNTSQVVGVDWQQPGRFFVTRDELLDKSMYDFDEGQVEKVTLQDGAKKFTLTREKSGGWTAKPEGSDQSFQVEGPKMSALIYAIGSLKWSRRLDPVYPNDLETIKAQNLENPGRAIALQDAEGKELAQLGQGSDGGEDGSEHYVYVRRAADDYYAVDKADFTAIKDAIDKITSTLGGGETK